MIGSDEVANVDLMNTTLWKHVLRCSVPLSLAHILNEAVYRLAGRFGIVIRPEKMDRNVGLVADDPAVVWHGRNVKKLTGA